MNPGVQCDQYGAVAEADDQPPAAPAIHDPVADSDFHWFPFRHSPALPSPVGDAIVRIWVNYAPIPARCQL